MKESGIYLHKAVDGNHHCSYDLEYTAVDHLEPPEETMFSTLEYIEGQYLQQDGSEELIQAIADEGERENPAPEVGMMHYEPVEQEIEELKWDLPDIDKLEEASFSQFADGE